MEEKEDIEIENIMIDMLSREEISPEQKEILAQWQQNERNKQKFHHLQRICAAIFANKMVQKVDCEKALVKVMRAHKSRKRILLYLPYAALAIILFGVGVFFTFRNKGGQEMPQQIMAQITAPVTNQPVLTLSNGQKIILSDTLGALQEQNGTTIQGGSNQLVYNPSDSGDQITYNTITIPRGAEYKLVLADGSIVWLNSSSEITYPVSFRGKSREVKLRGEAFFEIEKDTKHPFIVHTEQFDIRVTGTQFNVRTYPDDLPSTTLAEGSVQFLRGQQITSLVPGQQATLIGGKIQVKKVDLEEAIAWRYNAFGFKEQPLENLLNEVARWYDIEIIYLDSEARQLHFTAWFKRTTSLPDLLKILEKTQQIQLELKGKTLTVRIKS